MNPSRAEGAAGTGGAREDAETGRRLLEGRPGSARLRARLKRLLAPERPAARARSGSAFETRAAEESEAPGGGEESMGAARSREAPAGGGLGEPAREGGLLVWRECHPAGAAPRPESLRRPASSFPGADLRAGLERAGVAVDRLLCIDLETCGLADLPLFLAGALWFEGEEWILAQWLAPDPSREPELLERFVPLLEARSLWVSFNGRSFDLSRLRRRSRLHGLEPPAGREHRDLLHEVRRRWRHILPDCRLRTVERRLLGRVRGPGDVPGREVPERYWDFVRSGERRWIEPVVAHNRHDLATLALLLEALSR